MESKLKKQRYVIVGSGASGLSTIYTLQKYAKDIEIHLVESENRIGGHACSVKVPTDDININTGEMVDVGFMVFNKETYPNLIRIFEELKVPILESDMSLAVFDKNNSWSFQMSSAWLLKMLFRPRFWKFVRSHAKFSQLAKKYLANPNSYDSCTVHQFCNELNEKDFTDNWLLPFIAAVWSVGVIQSNEFAILPLLRFLDNHRFLAVGTVQWFTPAFRSDSYVTSILNYCENSKNDNGNEFFIHKGSPAIHIDSKNKLLQLKKGETIPYDKLILTCNAPKQVLLSPPSKKWLQSFTTATSRIVGHTKPYGMPNDEFDWCSWNVKGANDKQIEKAASVTYWLSRIQKLKSKNRFVTVNPKEDPEGIFYDEYMEHPVMNNETFNAQKNEALYQGIDDIYYAGAWLRNGFHEDAFFTGCLAARRALANKNIPIEYPTSSKGIIEPQAVQGITKHVRYGEKPRDFSYPLYLYKWDAKHPPNNYFREDFFGDSTIPLDSIVRREISNRLGFWPIGRIDVVANLRYAGFSFNPITPFFIHDENDKLVALLCEVHNTPWGEKCLYAMNVSSTGKLIPNVIKKEMHVSPFNPPVGSTASTENISSKHWNYIFELKGESFISVTTKNENDEVIITATWDIRNTNERNNITNDKIDTKSSSAPNLNKESSKTHNIKTGSWRTLFWIYFQALLMIKEGHRFHPYETNHLSQSFFNCEVLSLLWAIIPSILFYVNNQLIISILVSLSMLCMLNFNLSGGVSLLNLIGFIFCSFLLIIALCFSTIVNIVSWKSLTFLITSIFLTFAVFPSPKNNHQTKNWISFIQVSIIGCIWCCTGSAVPFYYFIFGYCYFLLGFCFASLNFSIQSLIFFQLSKLLIHLVTDKNIEVRLVEKNKQNTIIEVYSDDYLPSLSGKPVLLVHHPVLFFWGVLGGDLGVGESYVNGDWSELRGTDQRSEELFKILRVFANYSNSPLLAYLNHFRVLLPSYWIRKLKFLEKFGSLDRKSSAESIANHYNDGNDLFASFLDSEMIYTSALFDDTKPQDHNDNSLYESQQRKINRLIELCNLPKGGKLLDIGSGWGGLVGNALTKKYEAKGICNCTNMINYAKQKYGDDHFEILDYRDIPKTENYDGITCVEMIEAIPARDYKLFVNACDNALKPGKNVTIQVINALGFNNPVARRRNPLPLGTFVTTHIFPGQQLPNLEFIHEAFLESKKFKRLYSETTGHHYARTLDLWSQSLMKNQHHFPEKVINKYIYYLCWCRAAFDAELLQLSRIVFQKIN